jgi:hypothetical protein
MPLEDLTGSKYVNSLNDAWPLGTDSPSAGDDHIRGVKHTLKLSFPTITGAVTRALVSMNRGSVPIGSKTVFYQATAPAGWTRVTGITGDYGLRILNSTDTTGGTAGGTHDPFVMPGVAAHTHSLTGMATHSASVNHTHTIPAHNTAAEGAHAHQTLFGVTAVAPGGNTVYTSGTGYGLATNSVGDHSHTIAEVQSGQQSQSHNHAISGNTQVNAGAITWAPRYGNFILCERTS